MFYADRVKEASASTGLGDFLLTGAPSGYRTFSSIAPVGEPLYYCIDGGVTGEWEVGIGVLSGATTLVRSTVKASSNSNLAVSFSEGTKSVFITIAADGISVPAEMQATLDRIDDSSEQFVRLLNRLMFLSNMQTPASELRVSVISGTLPAVTTVSTVSAVTAVASVTNQVAVGGYNLGEQVRDQMNSLFALAIRANIAVS